jgi:CheY-like chemotaxis protein
MIIPVAGSPLPSPPENAGTAVEPRVILIVDDNAEFADTCARVLRAAGHIVVTAPDHCIALEQLESKQPVDLLLTDLVMPDRVNGMALARMARLRRPGIGVLYMTAYDIPGAEQEAIGPILHKPVDNEVLIQEVGRILDTIGRSA